MTSAPRSPSIIVHSGPASTRVRSRTRTPLSGSNVAMIRKMMKVRRIGGIGLLCAGACARSYLGSGPRGETDLSGSYSVQAQPVTNKCGEVTGEQVRSRVDVQHLPREME